MERDWSTMVATVRRLLDRNGRSVSIQQLGAIAADSTRPWRGAATPTVAVTRTLKACFVPATADEFGRSIANDDMLASVQQIALMEPSDIELEKFDTILDGGSRYAIKWSWTLKPGSTILLYAFGVVR